MSNFTLIHPESYPKHFNIFKEQYVHEMAYMSSRVFSSLALNFKEHTESLEVFLAALFRLLFKHTSPHGPPFTSGIHMMSEVQSLYEAMVF